MCSRNQITIGLIAALAVLTCAAVIYISIKKSRLSLSQNSCELHTTQLTHLALIMDGNRRWAQERGLESWQGHQKGVGPLKQAIEFCLEQQIPYLTVWAFSLQNFKRKAEELNYLFNILAEQLAHKEAQELADAGIKIKVIGDRSRYPSHLVPLIDAIEEKTKNNTKLTLVILFCYSGREDIIQACKKIATQIENKTLTADNITAEFFEKQLWTHGIPDPDLVIRTGKGNTRLSNFMQYQCAYSELYFLDCNWPDVTKQHLQAAVNQFAHTKRNFGQ